jgi:Lon protease-like protein
MLAMICPFSADEKQALLEAGTAADRASLLVALMEMALGEAGHPAGDTRH